MNHYTEKAVTETSIRKKTFISLFFLLLFMCAALYGWNRLLQEPKNNEALVPLRKGLNANEWIFSHLFSNKHLAKEFTKADVVPARFNGGIGIDKAADTTAWKLHVVRKPGDTLLISLDELKALPKTEVIFDFKCIEGWSQVTRWAGVRFSDFVAKYGLYDQAKMNYAGLVTPDEQYYVGIDMPSMMHPQTILCYELDGKPLPLNQGYPLRLIIPVKYGVKHLKRIGTLSFSDDRPKDYWYEQGYDYYCGL